MTCDLRKALTLLLTITCVLVLLLLFFAQILQLERLTEDHCGIALAQVEQDPEHFRTLGALQRTLLHLRGIMDAPGAALVDIHKFLWDRFRGVR